MSGYLLATMYYLLIQKCHCVGVADPNTDPYWNMCSVTERHCGINITDSTKQQVKRSTLPEASVEKIYFRKSFVKPFVVYYEKFQRDTSKLSVIEIESLERSFCSGSLVSSQHVLSAAHCVCVFKKDCARSGFLGRFEVQYDPTKHITLWVGLSTNDLEFRYKAFPNILDANYKVSSVLLHPLYQTEGLFDLHDICILKLSRPVCQAPKIQPIHLPTPEILERIGNGGSPMGNLTYGSGSVLALTYVHTGGYGISNEDKHTCKTTRNGPAPFQYCKFPFKVKLPEESHLQCKIREKLFHGCVPITELFPPNYYQRQCREFESIWSSVHNGTLQGLLHHNNPWLSPQNYQVINEANNCTNQCYTYYLLLQFYPVSYSKYGWCATCDQNANPGEPNYCGVDSSKDLEAEMAVAEPNRNWGFCQWNCSDRSENLALMPNYEDGPNMYLSEKDCAQLLQNSINLTTEFCSSYVNVEDQRRFKINSNGTISQVPYRLDNLDLKYTGSFHKSRYICEGDSGGPLWINWPDVHYNETDVEAVIHENGSRSVKFFHYDNYENAEDLRGSTTSFILGVTRRGEGCGYYNKPAIFAKVQYYLDWIKDNIKDAENSTNFCLTGTEGWNKEFNSNLLDLDKLVLEPIGTRGIWNQIGKGKFSRLTRYKLVQDDGSGSEPSPTGFLGIRDIALDLNLIFDDHGLSG
ncbi:uncharacterized protein LOC131887189 [Tigriopus californicus]|uniref:uncharacterized protein LOC131887189 n=1 Tax=Tigriopus californicus TaxID=6832 RepID=UPI0027DAAF10|nr:uncharacterized protein LOC131887189 [Tigriopus californicus]